jgi:hypothetical protein
MKLGIEPPGALIILDILIKRTGKRPSLFIIVHFAQTVDDNLLLC